MLSRMLIAALALVSTIAPITQAQEKATPEDASKPEIRKLIDGYLKSVDLADVDLAAKVWSTTPRVSFINPRGHELGWQQIADSFYRKSMGETFTTRKLLLNGEPRIEIYGDSAVVEFNWKFDAVLGANGQAMHTEGRETQVYAKIPQSGWRLVHVHYSGPAVTGVARGF